MLLSQSTQVAFGNATVITVLLPKTYVMLSGPLSGEKTGPKSFPQIFIALMGKLGLSGMPENSPRITASTRHGRWALSLGLHLDSS